MPPLARLAVPSLLAPLVLCACVSFRAGQLGDEPALAPPAARPDVAVVVTAYDLVGGERRDVDALPQWTEWVLGGYRKTGFFEEVRRGFGDADLHVEVTLERRDESNLALASLSGLTLTVLPAWGSAEMTMISRFRDADGNELATTRKTETVHVWIQLLLLFALPFGFPTVVAEDTFDALVLHSVAEAAPQLDGAATASASPGGSAGAP